MAKGLRSKSARKYRAIKRETIFGPVETARVHRLSERLKKDAEGLKTSEIEALARGEEKMEVEKGECWRDSCSHWYFVLRILDQTGSSLRSTWETDPVLCLFHLILYV